MSAAHCVANGVLVPGQGRTIRGQLQLVIDRFVSHGLDTLLALAFVGEVPSAPPGSSAAQAVLALEGRMAL